MKERPVAKVVRLLQDMKAELQQELDDDKAVMEKLDCWCKTNDKQKTAAIEFGQQEVARLESEMDETTASILKTREKRKATWDEVQRDHKALEQATTLRMDENKKFQAESTDLIEAIDACDNAITVLSEHHPDFMQMKKAAVRLSSSKVSQLMVSTRGLRSFQVSTLKGFLAQASKVASSSAFLAIPGFKSYTPQSGQIFGILKQMRADFKNSLSDSEKAELKAKEDYEALKAAKEDEMDSGNKAVAAMDQQLAKYGEQHANAADLHTDTEKQLGMDQEFLAKLKKTCAQTDKEFETRTKARLDEIAAVEETISILNSDEAFNNFDKTLAQTGPAFVQMRSIHSSKAEEQLARNHAIEALRRASRVDGASPRVALIAASAQLDAFEKVKAEIDKLVAELLQMQKEEVKQRDLCNSDLAENQRETAANQDRLDAGQVKRADLEKDIENFKAEIKRRTEEVAAMQEQMKRAGEAREGENADFQTTINDQRMTQMILNKALTRMKQVYAFLQSRDQPGAAHIATSATHTDPGNAPVKFKEYEQNAGGSRIVTMLEEVIADSHKTEDQAIAAEQDAQEAYETFMKDSNASIKSHQAALNRLGGNLATGKEELSMTIADNKQTFKTLEDLNGVNQALHQSCDFLLKNFDARQEARSAEVEALREAKAILSGMK